MWVERHTRLHNLVDTALLLCLTSIMSSVISLEMVVVVGNGIFNLSGLQSTNDTHLAKDERNQKKFNQTPPLVHLRIH